MTAGDPATPPSPLRQAWAAQLPQRIERLRRRGTAFVQAGDVNVLRLVADDARRLAHACDTLGAEPLSAQLGALATACFALLDPPRAPDRSGLAQIAGLIEKLPLPAQDGGERRDVRVAGAEREPGSALPAAPSTDYRARLQAAAATRARTPQPSATAPAQAIPQHRLTQGSASTTSREQLLRQLSECLAGDDSAIRNGGLLVLVPDGSDARAPAHAAARSAEVLRALCALAPASDRIAADAGGRYLVLNGEFAPPALAQHAEQLRERCIRAGLGSFDVGLCAARGARNAGAMYEAARRVVHVAQSQRRRGVFAVEDIDAGGDDAFAGLIRSALAGPGFEILYQPIVSVRGDDGERFQALLRLRDPAGHLHPASEIVPAAENAGLIGAIDRWIIERCIDRIVANGAGAPCLFVSQSIASLRDPQAPAAVAAALGSRSLGTDALVVELRANDAIEAPVDVQRYAGMLHRLGIRLSLSGFDADLADVHPLPTLAFDYVKIVPLPPDATPAMREAFVALIERMHERGVRVIAPRVEDARSAAALSISGVDLIQGNFVQAADSEFAFDFRGQQM